MNRANKHRLKIREITFLTVTSVLVFTLIRQTGLKKTIPDEIQKQPDYISSILYYIALASFYYFLHCCLYAGPRLKRRIIFRRITAKQVKQFIAEMKKNKKLKTERRRKTFVICITYLLVSLLVSKLFTSNIIDNFILDFFVLAMPLVVLTCIKNKRGGRNQIFAFNGNRGRGNEEENAELAGNREEMSEEEIPHQRQVDSVAESEIESAEEDDFVVVGTAAIREIGEDE